MKKIIFRLLLLVILAAAGFYLWSMRFSHKNENQLPVSGNIELTQVDISFKVPGKLVELDVDEGTFVKKGMVIARIDRDQVEQQRSRDEASVAASAVAVSTNGDVRAMAAPDAGKRHRVAEGGAARGAGASGSAAGRIAAAGDPAGAKPPLPMPTRSTIRPRPIGIARRSCSRTTTSPRQQYDQYRMRLDSTTAVLRQAQEQLALVEEGPRKEDIEAARAEVERAQAALQASEANRLELKRREEDVKAHLRRCRSRQGAGGHDANADQRHGGDFAHRRRGAGEVGRSRRGAGGRDHRGHHRRHRSSLAARLHQRDRLGPREAGPAGRAHHRFVSRQNLSGPRFVHLFGSRIHAQADSDPRGAREAGVSHQNRRGQSAARAEVQHAGGRGDSTE